jgi:hypothetical protein
MHLPHHAVEDECKEHSGEVGDAWPILGQFSGFGQSHAVVMNFTLWVLERLPKEISG